MDALPKLSNQNSVQLSIPIDKDAKNFSRYGLYPPFCPDAAAVPQNTEEVRDAVRLAAGQRAPILPVGGGTSLWQGMEPVKGGLALSLKSMNKILEIRPNNLTAVVEAGVTNAQLQAALQPYGLRLPVLPAIPELSTLGGEAARNLGGPKNLRFGSLRHFVLGAEYVTAEGKIVRAGGKSVKNVAGYDLSSLVVGSWGTLGIITSLIIRLIPNPEQEKIFFTSYAQLKGALIAASELLHAGLSPAAVHLLSPAQAAAIPDLHLPKGWLLVTACDGTKESLARHEAKIMSLGGHTSSKDTSAEMDAYWRQSVNAFNGRNTETDEIAGTISVPKKFAGETARELAGLTENNVPSKLWVDLGTGRLRFALPAKGANWGHLQTELVRLASTHQGILAMDNPLQIVRPTKPPAYYQLLGRLKDTVDPFRILNPQALVLKGVQ
ncbi:MAG: FAD-binding oxidoreductase [Bacillota bacterium]